jgi:predicted NUDIX family phosphoesterase
VSINPELRLILAADAAGLPPIMAETGFVPMEHGSALRFLEKAGLWFGPRRVLEELEGYRQVIPYIVLCVGDRVVRYRRTPAGGETRLHGRTSVGLGGHVDLVDARSADERFDLFATVEQAAEREITEELGDVTCLSRRWVGLLVDNDTPVGRVHIGLIGIWHIERLPDRQAEDAVGEVAAVSLAQLKNEATSLETWSALLLPWLESELTSERRELSKV